MKGRLPRLGDDIAHHPMKTRPAPANLSPVSELARRAGLAPSTARRRLQSAGIEPQAVLIAGSKPPVPLFPPSAAESIATAPIPAGRS